MPFFDMETCNIAVIKMMEEDTARRFSAIDKSFSSSLTSNDKTYATTSTPSASLGMDVTGGKMPNSSKDNNYAEVLKKKQEDDDESSKDNAKKRKEKRRIISDNSKSPDKGNNMHSSVVCIHNSFYYNVFYSYCYYAVALPFLSFIFFS